MTIEAGKWYRCRGGARFYVCATNRPNKEAPVVGWYDDNMLGTRRPDGTYKSDEQNNLDLISEWREELNIPWAELFPPWVKWFAVDRNGGQYGYRSKPSLAESIWTFSPEDEALLQLPVSLRIPFTGDWKESLTERKS